MKEEKKTRNVRHGLPASEEELREWKKSFTDIQESIKALYERDGEKYNNDRDLLYDVGV
jgi:hypothetical protein